MTRAPRGKAYGVRSAPYVFLVPATLLFLLFFALPIGYAVYLSFRRTEVRGLGLGKGARDEIWAGLSNYTDAISDSELLHGALRILGYGAIVVPVMLGLALLFALLLDTDGLRLRGFTRLAIFLPYAIPGVIAALMWGFLYLPDVSPSCTCSTRRDCRSPICWTAGRCTCRWRTSRCGAAPAST